MAKKEKLSKVSVEEIAEGCGVFTGRNFIISDIELDGISMACCNKTTAACWTQM